MPKEKEVKTVNVAVDSTPKSGDWIYVTAAELNELQLALPAKIAGYKPFLDEKGRECSKVIEGKNCVGEALIK